MSWPFLHVRRDVFHSRTATHGVLFMISRAGHWQRLCYTYELPWRPNAQGKSTKYVSCIELGIYEMHVREDGKKGWRLELKRTGHRTEVQVHRAAPDLYIEGCILPIHFNNYTEPPVKTEDPVIQSQSLALMRQIRDQYEQLKPGKKGNATILISAVLPPVLQRQLATARA